MGADPELGRAIQFVERSHSSEPKRGQVGIFDQGSIQIAPRRGQNIHRCVPAFLALIADLGGEVNERDDHAARAEHLPDRADHIPVQGCHVRNRENVVSQSRTSRLISSRRLSSPTDGMGANRMLKAP